MLSNQKISDGKHVPGLENTWYNKFRNNNKMLQSDWSERFVARTPKTIADISLGVC